MRVAMVTPMALESAIADVMCQAVPELAAHWDLEIWCPAETAHRSVSVPLNPYVSADSDVVRALAEYDLVVYVLGDSPWHSRILPLALELPGLAVLHDVSMSNLVRHVATEAGTFLALVEYIRESAGPDLADAFAYRHGAPSPAEHLELCARLPLDDYVARNSLGVVVHSRWHAERVDGLLLGNVTVAPLPVPSSRLGIDLNERADPAHLLASLPDDAFLLVTVGNLNANRHIDLLLRALAADIALSNVHLWAVGAAKPGDAAEARRLARSLGLERRFSITGRVSDASLAEILARADLGAALRQPVLEGQSASALTMLLSGTPVLVYDHAHYSELPNDVAVKIPPDTGPGGIAVSMRRMVEDTTARVSMGERARDYALRSRSGTAYAAALLQAGELALESKVHAHLRIDLGARLKQLGLHQEPTVLEATTKHAFDLFDLE